MSRGQFDWAELRHFRYLLAVLEKQGFRVAAEELNTSQPNLTVQARQFQENASIRLFRRSKSGRIRPTETGLAFISLAKLLLDTRDEVISALQAIDRNEIGSVRFGCSPLVEGKLFRSFCTIHKELLPSCSVTPTLGDPSQLAEEIVAGTIDAALVTLPLRHDELRIETLRRERLVACLRRDSELANKIALDTRDLEGNLKILHHPQRHPAAHRRLMEMLREVGIGIDQCSYTTHPTEMEALVKDGHGLALVREGTITDPELTTRTISGIDWTIDTAVVCHRSRFPKTVAVAIRKLRRQYSISQPESGHQGRLRIEQGERKGPASERPSSVQLALLDLGDTRRLSGDK